MSFVGESLIMLIICTELTLSVAVLLLISKTVGMNCVAQYI